MAGRSLGALVAAAAALHALLLAACFDVYFRSPLVPPAPLPALGNPPVAPAPPARRLALLVADGLRATSFLATPANAPHLHSIIENGGSWGISNTRIPTESRPGHVAIIAGFYEDPSAIAKGWKENPVDFDSVFNQSRYTWSWGSPDILPMFSKGAAGNHVYADFYSHAEEDFSGKISTTKLDTWVFDKVEKFFFSAKNNEALMKKLKSDKIIFFLHLLGLDTAGHTHKPHSKQYKENIRVVDKGIAKIEKIIENFYGDDKTAYIFTADHGMTDWGSHGAGSDDETKTPFVAWGAGVASVEFQKELYENAVKNFKYPPEIEIQQADICPLMASLIGIDIPFNSVGTIPEVYLNGTLEEKAGFFYKNMRQIVAQYNTKRISVEESAIKLIYKPFDLTDNKIREVINNLDNLLTEYRFADVIKQSKALIKLSLEGLNYYQNYYQRALLSCTTMSFLGWIFWLLTVLLQDTASIEKKYSTHTISKRKFSKLIDIIFVILLMMTVYLIYAQSLPLQYYIYFILPIALWRSVFLSWNLWYKFFSGLNEKFQSSYTISYIKLFLIVSLYIFGIVVLVISFFHRWALSFGLLGVAMFPLYKSYRQNLSKLLLFVWVLTCLILAGFSFLPVIGKQDDKHLVGASGVCWFITTMIFLHKFSLPMLKSGKETKSENVILLIPAIMMLTALQNKYFVAYQFNNKSGLSLLSQILSWTLGGLSFIIPLLSSRWMISRLFSINSCLAVFFILLSVSHEGFFLLVLVINLFCWLCIEHNTAGYQKDLKISQWSFTDANKGMGVNKLMTIDRVLNSDDFRRSYIFLLYIILSFFGTGNIASVNSFDPQWVRSFISQFSPFTMAALILSKTLIPFLSVACTFCAVNMVVKAPTGHLFLIVLIFSDIMGIFFLHMVTNEGSWLDIGTSLSHYVIMETTVFFVSILYGVGQLLTRTSLSELFKRTNRLKKI